MLAVPCRSPERRPKRQSRWVQLRHSVTASAGAKPLLPLGEGFLRLPTKACKGPRSVPCTEAQGSRPPVHRQQAWNARRICYAIFTPICVCRCLGGDKSFLPSTATRSCRILTRAPLQSGHRMGREKPGSLPKCMPQPPRARRGALLSAGRRAPAPQLVRFGKRPLRAARRSPARQDIPLKMTACGLPDCHPPHWLKVTQPLSAQGRAHGTGCGQWRVRSGPNFSGLSGASWKSCARLCKRRQRVCGAVAARLGCRLPAEFGFGHNRGQRSAAGGGKGRAICLHLARAERVRTALRLPLGLGKERPQGPLLPP